MARRYNWTKRSDDNTGEAKQLRMPDGRTVEIPLRTAYGKQATLDWSGFDPCENCGTYTSRDGHMLGACGRLSVYWIDPKRVWICYSVACPECVFGAFARTETRYEDFYRPALPYDYEKDRFIPAGLTHKEWRVLHIWSQTGDTYLDAANRISSEYKSAKCALLDKLTAWSNRRMQS